MVMMPLAAIVAKSLGKRVGKVTAESTEVSGDLSKFISEMLKGSKIIKIYQQESREFEKAKKIINKLKDKFTKIGLVQIRATPIMEVLTGIIIAGFIYYTGLIISSGQIEIGSFF
jgi:subfamily B ATP-binding cassette protein MsbA